MSVPEKTMDAGWRMVHEETVYEQYEATVDALTDPALGSDRLVVAGPHEQEIIEKVAAWLYDEAIDAYANDQDHAGRIFNNMAQKIEVSYPRDES